jgi:hypothetical protein
MQEAAMPKAIEQEIRVGDTFFCPFCKAKYRLDWLDTGPYVYPARGKPCEHLDPYISFWGDDVYHVTFMPPVEEDAPLAQKLDYLLRSTSPFRAWLARLNPWDIVGQTGKGDQTPLAIFISKHLKPKEVWVTPEGAIYVRAQSGEAVFIPRPSRAWIHMLVRELHKYKDRSWTALEVLAIIEDISRSIYR